MNNKYGSLEGGDQGVLVRYLCPDWYTVNDDNKDCGRIPWKYNVESQLYQLYKVYLAGYSMDKMKVIHFTNDGKPWKSLLFDYQIDQYPVIPDFFKSLQTPNYIPSHLYWRYCFIRSTGHPIPPKSIFYESWEDVIRKKGVFQHIQEILFDDSLINGDQNKVSVEATNDRSRRKSYKTVKVDKDGTVNGQNNDETVKVKKSMKSKTNSKAKSKSSKSKKKSKRNN